MTDFRHQARLQLSKLTHGICKSNLGTKADYVAKHGAVEEGRQLHRVIMKGKKLIVSYATNINKPQLGRKGKETTKKQNDDEVKKKPAKSTKARSNRKICGQGTSDGEIQQEHRRTRADDNALGHPGKRTLCSNSRELNFRQQYESKV